MKYSEGTVSLEGGKTLVTGQGTHWRDNVKAGDVFILDAFLIAVQIAQVIDDTRLRLARPVPGLPEQIYSGMSYLISADFTPHFDMPYPNPGDLDTAELYNRAIKIAEANMPELPS